MARRRIVPLLTVALTLVAAGCSSGHRKGASVGAQLAGPGSAHSPSTDPATGSVTVPQPAGATSARSAATGAAKAKAGGATSSGAGPVSITSRFIPGSGPGITPTEIHIGVSLGDPNSGTEITAAFGAKFTNDGGSNDDKTVIEPIIAYINAHGGVAGRKLVAHYLYIDVVQTTSWDTQSQATCDHFTTDTKVFAVIQLVNDTSPVLPSCLTKKHVVLFDDGNSTVYDRHAIANQFDPGYFYSPSRLVLDRLGVQVTGLAQQGYFDRGSKIGLLTYDAPQFHRTVDQVFVPALKGLSLAATDAFYFTVPDSAAGISGIAAQAQNAVLKFKTEGIDHVLFIGSLSALPFLWMPEAENQGYRPRYGISSTDLPAFLQGNESASQLARSIAVGWSRANDVATQDWNDTPQARLCMEIIRPSARNNPSVGYTVACDPFFLLQTALNAATVVSGPGLRSAIDHLGTAFHAADTPGTAWGPDSYDGISGYRADVFQADCSCYRYAGPVRAVP